MSDLKKAVLFGAGFVAAYFLVLVVTLRLLYSFGYDPYRFNFLQLPVTFPLHLIPFEFWAFLSGADPVQKSFLITAVYLMIDVIVYSFIGYTSLRMRQRPGYRSDDE